MPARFALLTRQRVSEVVAVLLVLLASVYVYTRFGRNILLNRDQGIYTYGGLRFSHGVAPYVSIWDPKTPGASMLCGAAAAAGRLVGANSLTAIRLAFLATGVATALALYALARVLWSSLPAGLVAAAAFLSFRSFAISAASGPDAKMPGIALLVLAMLLLVRKKWVWAGLAAGLAFLFWQPLLIYVAVAIGAAWFMQRRWRAGGAAALGAAVPIVGIAVYFLAVGAFRTFVEAAFVQPAVGAPSSDGLVESVQHIASVVRTSLGPGVLVFWIGLAFVVALAVERLIAGRAQLLQTLRDPLLCVVLLTLLGVVAFSIRDFQQYPDLDPLLPYPALGFGGAFVALLRLLPDARTVRVGLTTGVAAGAVVLLAVAGVHFRHDRGNNHLVSLQRAQSCALNQIVGPGVVWALGNPVPLVFAHRVNPDNFIYFQGGVLAWKLQHLQGGLHTWQRQILASDPRMFVVDGWKGPLHDQMGGWLRDHFQQGYLGDWRVFFVPGTRSLAHSHGIVLTNHSVLIRSRAERVQYFGARCT